MDVYDHNISDATSVTETNLHELITCVRGKLTVYAQFATQNCLCATTGISTTVEKLRLRHLSMHCLDTTTGMSTTVDKLQ